MLKINHLIMFFIVLLTGCSTNEFSMLRTRPYPIARWTSQDQWEAGTGILMNDIGPKIPGLQGTERGLVMAATANDNNVGGELGWYHCLRGTFDSGVFAGIKGKYRYYHHDGQDISTDDSTVGLEASLGACGSAAPVTLSAGAFQSLDTGSVRGIISIGVGL